MPSPSIPALAALGNQLFTSQRRLPELFDPYTVEEMLNGFAQSVSLLERAVGEMSEGQLTFRIPGTPSSPDWNHDQHHFNTPELVTHLIHTIKNWQDILHNEGLPVPSPVRPWPPTPHLTGMHGPGRGVGGRSDVSKAQLVEALSALRTELIPALYTVSADVWRRPYESDRFGHIELRHFVLVMALHTGAHTVQLLEMQAHPEYPPA